MPFCGVWGGYFISIGVFSVATGSKTIWDNVTVKPIRSIIENGDFSTDSIWDHSSSIGLGTSVITGNELVLTSGTPYISNRGISTNIIYNFTPGVECFVEIENTSANTGRIAISDLVLDAIDVVPNQINRFRFTPTDEFHTIYLYSPRIDGQSVSFVHSC